MNQEWQHISTAPRCGELILILNNNEKIIIGYFNGTSCYKHMFDCFSDDKRFLNPSMWHPLPELPKIKMHKCDYGGFVCESLDPELMVLYDNSHNPVYDEVRVKFCPFCGLKAEKGEGE